MSTYQKQYELLRDIRKITLPKETSYDTLVDDAVVHDPILDPYPPIDFPGGLYPPKGPLMNRMNSVFGNPWNQPKTWGRDGYIEDSLAPNGGKVKDQTVVLCILSVLVVVFGLLYMTYRLLRNGWCRYRKGRAIQDAKGVNAWGRWIDSVCLKVGGGAPTSHLDRLGNKRIHSYSYPV